MEETFDSLVQPTDKKFGFSHALLLIALANIIFLIISTVVQFGGQYSVLLNKWFMFISYTLSFWVSLILAKVWWQVGKFDTKAVKLIVYLLLIPMVIAMSIVMEGVVNLIPMPEKIRQLFEQAMQINLQGYLTLGIAAPILEELIFRGVVLKKFLKNYTPEKAIVLSAAVFGIAHLNPWQFVAAFAIGIVIGWVYYKTRSIWPGIFMHWTNNTFSFYLAKKYENVNITFKDVIGNNFYYITLLIICLLICYAVYLILNKFFEKTEAKHNNTFGV